MKHEDVLRPRTSHISLTWVTEPHNIACVQGNILTMAIYECFSFVVVVLMHETFFL